jgi:uncharacterized OsmC-like protein
MTIITSIHKGEMLFETTIGRHTVINDVTPNPEWGGKDRAPTPPDYLAASLSSCVAAYAVKYCSQSGINVEGLRVDIQFEKATNPTHLKDIKLNVYLPNADVGSRLQAIKRACEHCTVSETIARMGQLEVNIFDSKNQ